MQNPKNTPTVPLVPSLAIEADENSHFDAPDLISSAPDVLMQRTTSTTSTNTHSQLSQSTTFNSPLPSPTSQVTDLNIDPMFFRDLELLEAGLTAIQTELAAARTELFSLRQELNYLNQSLTQFQAQYRLQGVRVPFDSVPYSTLSPLPLAASLNREESVHDTIQRQSSQQSDKQKATLRAYALALKKSYLTFAEAKDRLLIKIENVQAEMTQLEEEEEDIAALIFAEQDRVNFLPSTLANDAISNTSLSTPFHFFQPSRSSTPSLPEEVNPYTLQMAYLGKRR